MTSQAFDGRFASTLDAHKALLDAGDELPTLPTVAIELATAINDPRVTLADIESIIVGDSVTTTRILREANSVASAPAQSIGTIERAVARLGTARVLAVAVHAHLTIHMARPLVIYEFEANELNRHSVVTSWAAEMCLRLSPRKIGREVVAAALLHDLGKIVIEGALKLSPDDPVLSYGLDTRTLELELVDADHGEVGADLLEHWRLPQSIVEAVRYHHEPTAGLLPGVVGLADWVAHVCDGDQPDQERNDGIDEAISMLGLDGHVGDIVEGVRARLAQEQPLTS